MLVTSVPLGVIATEVTVSTEPVASDLEDLSVFTESVAFSSESIEFISDDKIAAVSEITALRTESVKHFSLPDGTYQAVSYATPVHRMDKNGVWQDIDNTLVLTRNAEGVRYASADDRVRFAETLKTGEDVVTFSENGYTIKMAYMGTLSSGKNTLQFSMQNDFVLSSNVMNAPARNAEKAFDTLEDASKIDNRSSITYSHPQSGVDIEYVLSGNDIKENIILKTTADSYEYVFRLDLQGLTATMNDKGEIYLTDTETKKIKYTIPSPYMYDASGEISYDVSYELQTVKSGIYLFKVSAGETWIESSERIFPIVIDPSITQYGTVNDSYAHSQYPDTNYGSHTTLYVSNYRTAYIWMELPALPSGATFNSAWLEIYYYYIVTEGTLQAKVYPVLSSWSEETLTYNNAPAIGTTEIHSGYMPANISINSSTPRRIGFWVSSIVDDWYNGEAINYGFAIKRTAGTNSSVIVYSSEASSYNPYLTVNYSYQLQEGVYALKNSAVQKWLSVKNDSPWEDGGLETVAATTSPTASFDRSCLFKISRQESTGRYIVRSMINNNLTLSVSGTTVTTKIIPSDDENVALGDTFFMDWNGYGHSLRNSNYELLSSASNGTDVTSRTDIVQLSCWEVTKYSGDHRAGSSMIAPSYWADDGINIGESGEATLYGWSTYIDANTIEAEIDPDYTHRASLVWNDDDDTLLLTAKKPGAIRINRKIKYSDGTIASSSGMYFFRILPLAGTYFIQNAGTERFIDVEGPSKNDGAIIQQWNYHAGNQSKFVIEHIDGARGYVRLKSVYSNKYVGVDTSNTGVIRQYATPGDHTLWAIDANTKNNLTFTCKATESSGVKLAVPLNSNSNGTDLTQLIDTDDTTLRDEWYLNKKVISCVNYYDLTFAGNTTYINNIAAAVSFANTMYSRQFYVGIYKDGNAMQYLDAIADDCQCGANNPCSASSGCGSNCANHHKNVDRILNQLLGLDREDDHIYVLWSDREPNVYCVKKNGTHTLYDSTYPCAEGSVAATYLDEPVILFEKIVGTNASEQLGCMKINLSHEIAHVLGKTEAYVNEEHEKNNDYCVMQISRSIYYDSISVAFENNIFSAFCGMCHGEMVNCTANINIEGNE